MTKVTIVDGLEMFANLHPHPLDTHESLLRCPFCAHEAAYNDGERRGQSDNYTVAVHCTNTSCGVRTPEHYKSREAAAIAWNRRVAGVSTRIETAIEKAYGHFYARHNGTSPYNQAPRQSERDAFRHAVRDLLLGLYS